MKNIVTLFLICIVSLNVSAQEISQIPTIEKTGKYGFERIIEIENKTSMELFQQTKLFLIKRHVDNDFIIEIENQELFDNGSFPATLEVSKAQMTYTILYTFLVKFKDGKIKTTISDMKVSTNAQGTTSEVTLENFIENLNATSSGKKYAKKMNDSLSKSIIEAADKLLTDLTNSFSESETW